MGSSHSNEIGVNYFKLFEQGDFVCDEKETFSDIFNYLVKLCKNKKDKKIISCIQRRQKNQHFSSFQQGEFQKRITSPSQSLLQIFGYYSSNENEGELCGSQFKQCLYLDYPIGRLRDEINIRAYLNQPYSELEIWGILRSVVNGLVLLKQNDKKCKNISPSTIYISDKGFYQICELYYVKDSALIDEVILHLHQRDAYLSPGQINMVRDGALHDPTDSFQSDVFSLGISAIDAMFLLDQSDLFKYIGTQEEIGIDLLSIQERIKLLEKFYSKTLLNLIKRMIEKEEKNRIKIEELNQELQRNYLRVLQNQNEQIEISKKSPQIQTSYLPYIIKRNEYEKYLKNQISSYVYLKENQDSAQLLNVVQERDKRIITIPVFQDDQVQEDQIPQDQQKQHNLNALAQDEHIELKDDNAVEEQKLIQSAAIQPPTLNVQLKLKKSFPKIFLSQYLLKLDQLKKEKSLLAIRQQDLLKFGQGSPETIHQLELIEKQLLQNQQEEQELYQSQQQQNQIQTIDEEEQQEISQRQSMQQNSQEVQEPNQDIYEPQDNKQVEEEQEEEYQRQRRSDNQEMNDYYNDNANNNNNINQQQDNEEYYNYEQENEHDNQNMPQNITPRQYFSQQVHDEEINQQNQYEELFNKSPQKGVLNKYNERVNKHNICSDRYAGVEQLFENDGTGENKSDFKNRVVDKNSSIQSILTPYNSMKVIQQNNNLIAQKKPYTVTECQILPLNCNKNKFLHAS